MVDFNEHIDSLILQYSKRAISPNGLEELLFWIEKDIENKKYFKEQVVILRNIQATPVQFDVEKGLMELQKSKQTWFSSSLAIKITAIAATILLIVFIGQVMTNGLIDDSAKMIAYVAEKDNVTQIMDDSTKITLSTSSTLIAPKQFNSKSRQVKLVGKAFFDVAKDEHRPFKIQCENIDITVLGTSFEVEADTLNSFVKVTVTEGVVSVSSNKISFQKKVMAGTQLVVSQGGVLLNELKVKNENYLSWKTGVLIYDNTPMDIVAKDVMKMYGKNILFDNDALKNEHITAKINNNPFNEVRLMLEVLLNSKTKEQGDTLIFYKNH